MTPAPFVLGLPAVAGRDRLTIHGLTCATCPWSRRSPARYSTSKPGSISSSAGPEPAGRGVLMTSVDTGWITYEQPHTLAEQMRQRGSAPPLDAIDGAARILEPVFQSVFLKDYRPIEW